MQRWCLREGGNEAGKDEKTAKGRGGGGWPLPLLVHPTLCLILSVLPLCSRRVAVFPTEASSTEALEVESSWDLAVIRDREQSKARKDDLGLQKGCLGSRLSVMVCAGMRTSFQEFLNLACCSSFSHVQHAQIVPPGPHSLTTALFIHSLIKPKTTERLRLALQQKQCRSITSQKTDPSREAGNALRCCRMCGFRAGKAFLSKA